MRSNWKKLCALALALIMVLAILPTSVFASEGMLLYLKPSDNWREGDARFAVYCFNNAGGNEWISMQDDDEDGYYDAFIPSDYTTVIFCRMNPATTENDWQNKWNQTMDLPVPTDGTNCYTVAPGTWDKGAGTWSVFGEEVEPVYAVAGDEGLTGYPWSPNMQCMTYNEITGLYEFTFPVVQAGTYEFKITDGSWKQSWGNAEGKNCSITLDAISGVIIRFNAETKEITHEIIAPDYNAKHFTVAGDVGLCGVFWDPAQNPMTHVGNGVYEIIFKNIPAGTYEFKVTDGTWINSWGDGEKDFGIKVPEESHVKICFDMFDKTISVTLIPLGSPTITNASGTLLLENELKYRVYFTVENPNNMTIQSVQASVSSAIPGINGITEVSVLEDDTYYIEWEVPAKYMGDRISYEISVGVAGNAETGDSDYVLRENGGFSAVDYVKYQLANSTDEGLKSLCVTLMNYGAAAQIHFGYNTDNLMNSFLTEEQKKVNFTDGMIAALPEASKASTFDSAEKVGGLFASVTVGGTLDRNFYMIPEHPVDEGTMKLYIWNQAAYDLAEVLGDGNETAQVTMTLREDGYYHGASATVAKTMDEIIYVMVVYQSEGVTYTSGVVAYSIPYACRYYIDNGDQALSDLAKALVVYGSQAKAYFAGRDAQ